MNREYEDVWFDTLDERYEEVEGLNDFDEYDSENEVEIVRDIDYEKAINRASYLIHVRGEDLDFLDWEY